LFYFCENVEKKHWKLETLSITFFKKEGNTFEIGGNFEKKLSPNQRKKSEFFFQV
jgi:hypothetical protein